MNTTNEVADLLRFSPPNAKIKQLRKVKALQPYLANGKKIYSLDLLSGWSCPFANECLSKVHIVDGRKKVIDGPHTKFRCFSASQEALYPPVYNLRNNNYHLLRSVDWMSDLIRRSLPNDAGIVRIHVGGDFFNADYFVAWINIARSYPSTLFYAYTKSLPYWVEHKDIIPPNFILTASYGGRRDDLIQSHNLRYSVVVNSVYQAKKLKLPIDHDDSHACVPAWKDKPFALLVHGIQPAGSPAGKAVKRLNGKGSYGRKT